MNLIKRKLSFLLGLLAVFTSCDSSEVVDELGDYKVIQYNANSILHSGGNLQLWYCPPNAKKNLAWSYLVHWPKDISGILVFNGGVTDERIWNIFPAIFVVESGHPPVEISKLIAKKYCDMNGLDVSTYLSIYSFEIISSTSNSVSLEGSRTTNIVNNVDTHIKLDISRAELFSMVQYGVTNGVLKVYNNCSYFDCIPYCKK